MSTKIMGDDEFVAQEVNHPGLKGVLSTHDRITLVFTIPGEPRGQGRHRTRVIQPKGGGHAFGHNYSTKEDTEYRNLVKMCFIQCIQDVKRRGEFQMPGEHTPVWMKITCYFPIPKSRSKRWREAAAEEFMPCLTKPDCDNLWKIVADALSTIAYPDDKQVWCATVTKFYSPTPRSVVELSWFERKEGVES